MFLTNIISLLSVRNRDRPEYQSYKNEYDLQVIRIEKLNIELQQLREALEWDASFKNMNDPSGRSVKSVHVDSYK